MTEPDVRPDGPTDPRVRFAAERTLLAWVRTGVALIGFGFVIAKFGAFFREMAFLQGVPPPPQSGVSLWVGTGLVLFGVAVTGCAAAGHQKTMRRLGRGDPILPARLSLGVVVAVLLAVFGVAMAVYLALGPH